MAILQISRIQHRRGLKENLPQLASGELGWAIDTRQLYIGNGSIEEGAPTLGNTELLTQFSNLLEIGNSYRLLEIAPGLTAGRTVGRTLQGKLDDFINARDYGCRGDGETDDTQAINDLLFDVFCEWNNEESRRTVYFPAGIYITNGATIKIPTWAKIVGDGIGSTIIRRTDSGQVFELADSDQRVGGEIGISGGISPRDIDVSGLTFESTSGSVGNLALSRSIHFSRVRFQGPLTEPDSDVENYRGIFIESTPVYVSRQIIFDACEWDGLTYAVVIDDDARNVVISNGTLTNLYKGIKLGELTMGSGSSLLGPNVKIMGSMFDKISRQAIHVYGGQQTISAFNYFRDVGNDYQGANNPVSAVIQFDVSGHSSIGDQFDRDDDDDLIFPRITTSGIGSFGIVSGTGIQYGSARQRPGFSVTLDNNVSSAQDTGIDLNIDQYPVGAIIEYSISRGSSNRFGTMRVAHSTGTGPAVSDEYVESDSSVGVTFGFDDSGVGTSVKYITTNTGSNAVMRYQVRYLF